MVYNPSDTIARAVLFKQNEPSLVLSLDSNDAAAKEDLKKAVQQVVMRFANFHDIPIVSIARCEVLTGATANKLDRLESLVQDARNLLIEFESVTKSLELTEQYDAIMDRLDAEIGM